MVMLENRGFFHQISTISCLIYRRALWEILIWKPPATTHGYSGCAGLRLMLPWEAIAMRLREAGLNGW